MAKSFPDEDEWQLARLNAALAAHENAVDEFRAEAVGLESALMAAAAFASPAGKNGARMAAVQVGIVRHNSAAVEVKFARDKLLAKLKTAR